MEAFFARCVAPLLARLSPGAARRARRTAAVACLLALIGPATACAQFATVRGRVTDASDDQPLAGAAVVLRDLEDDSRRGTAADGNGYFILSRVPPGTYALDVSFVGYAPWSDTLAAAFGDRLTVDVHLERDQAELDEVVVESERDSGSDATFETIRPAALTQIAMPGTSADLARYLQTMPGVVAAGDRGGQLFVRGGTPTQNLVLLDGMPVFQPFHIVGFYSAFPADILAFADVYRGGFGARFGGRISSVIDVATRNGNKQRVTGAASVAPFLGAVRLEVPVVPEYVSVLASVRESLIERLAPDVLGEDLPYRFGDRFVKLHAFLNRTSSVSLTALNTFDRGDVADVDGRSNELRWRNRAYGGRYIYLPESYPVLTQLDVYASQLDNRYEPYNAPERTASAAVYGAEARFVYYLRQTELRIGLFAHSYRFAFDLGGSAGTSEEFVTEGGLYLDASFQFSPRLLVEPGLRAHSYPSRSQFTIEPRLRAEWRPGGRGSAHAFTAAWGVYHQQIIGLYNARDVTDVFVTWRPSPPNRRVPRAMHLLAGWQGRVLPLLTLQTTGYWKKLDDIAFAEYSDLAADGLRVEPVGGTARGVDVRAEVSRPSFYGSLSYGLSEVRYTRDAGGGAPSQDFHPPHDRRHQLSAVVRLERSPYAVNLTWQYGSGLPFTQVSGFYDQVHVGPPGDTSYRTDPGNTTLVSGALYAQRLPAYHRLDVAVERRFSFDRVDAVVQAAVINAYDRANLFNYDVYAEQRINQLPLIPSLGVKVQIR